VISYHLEKEKYIEILDRGNLKDEKP